MLRIKIKYKKGEEVKYLSHKDLMKAFQRAIRRAKLPINYSQGFNPHMKISWGQALKVGATSDQEYAELEMSRFIKPGLVMDALNRTLPPGLAILDAYMV
jgi:radical SAM-linked protein